MKEQKVFALGFHKTATSSMAHALYVLGYRLEGYTIDGFDVRQLDGLSREQARARVWEQMEKVLPHFDAVQDLPWPVFYRELDAAYPGSKFILTIRDTEPWLASVLRHFGSKRIPHHEWIYGVPCVTGHEEVYRTRYEQHNAEVIEYFADRPGDLLVFDDTTELNWQDLCEFLGCSEPPFPFPRQNQASAINRSFPARLARLARRSQRKLTRQPSDLALTLDLQRSMQDELDRFGSDVIEHLEAHVEDTEKTYATVTATLADVSARTQDLKTFLALDGPASKPRRVSSSESFLATWDQQARELRYAVGSVADHTVRDQLEDTGLSVHDAVKEIERTLRRCRQQIGTS